MRFPGKFIFKILGSGRILIKKIAQFTYEAAVSDFKIFLEIFLESIEFDPSS